MKCLIVYYSLHNATHRIASSIRDGLVDAGIETILYNIRYGPVPQIEGFDLIGIGSPVYYFNVPFNMRDTIRDMGDLSNKKVFVFLTYGSYDVDVSKFLNKALLRQNAHILGWYHSHGSGYFLGYNQLGVITSLDHPDAHELTEAKRFGNEIGTGKSDTDWPMPSEQPELMIRLERLSSNRFLTKHFLQKQFRVDHDRCIKCGTCVRGCPVHNLSFGHEGYPQWGDHCIICLNCDASCPQEAIRSPIRWAIIKPFLRHNLKVIKHDPNLQKTKIVHHHGRIEILSEES